MTPVIVWEGDGLSASWTGSDAERDTQTAAGDLWDELMLSDSRCAPERG